MKERKGVVFYETPCSSSSYLVWQHVMSVHMVIGHYSEGPP